MVIENKSQGLRREEKVLTCSARFARSRMVSHPCLTFRPDSYVQAIVVANMVGDFWGKAIERVDVRPQT